MKKGQTTKSRRRVQTSKFMSLVLRHDPAKADLELDESGWTEVDALLEGMQWAGHRVSRAELLDIVADCEKQRFALSEDGQRIRANQGHSVQVELGYLAQVPPAVLFHGTVARFLDSIRASGLIKGGRHHVHLSSTRETATTVGSRRGRPVLLEIDSRGMSAAGHEFFVTPNGVWLVEHVPAEFITFPGG